ncbi:MAG: glycosyltransferase [Candidatus Marinimicrobia bacterium]|nr:glycosyltransferase [Candidatus Neomarinimicrobiota bacterium]MCF7828555.1 glycosyltransferase [Candidatus Neomarinimicrobiota bacterium]MCF7880296.1 glycosyltransferase [Candidatus Neomarinimicrobiota bacterium]
MSHPEKVFIGSSVHNWNDPRVLHKQACSLAGYYAVELHVPADFQYKNFNGVEIYGLPEWEKKIHRVKIIFILAKRIIAHRGPIVHLHDPELLPLGFIVKLVTSKKVIFDFHEQYENKILKRDWIPQILRKPLSYCYVVLERIACRVFDGVIGVIEDQVDLLSENLNYCIVKNYPIIETDTVVQIEKENGENFKLIYMGDITRERRIHRLIEATFRLSEKFNVSLHLIGGIGDPGYDKELQCVISRYNLDEKVTVHGYLPINEAMELVKSSDVGFLPLRHPKHFVRSLPVKLFDYMSAGIPVIMPEYPLSRNVIVKYKCGLLVDSLDMEDIVTKVEYLIQHPQEKVRMGVNGRQAIQAHFSWQSQESILLKFYHSVININTRKKSVNSDKRHRL